MGGRSFVIDSRRISLFLLGTGYRAMLFHLGALQRLNDFGLLGNLSLVSSVSGGSIVAGALAAKWDALGIDTKSGFAAHFDKLVAEPIPELASTSMESRWRIAGMSLSKLVTKSVPLRYKQLVGEVSLADLSKGPKFVFHAT